MALAIFCFFVGSVLALSFYLGSKAKSAKGYYAAHGQIHWFVNGIAFAGDYLSAASFLGICGMIALYGYDGFLYSIGYLAGWVVALFVVAEPLKRMGRFTFADALDSRFNSRGIKLAAAISTLVVSIFYLIPQMVGAGQLIKPLLHFEHYQGVLIVGVVVVLIVTTAGMVSTTWVQFIKGSLLVIFCGILVFMILSRGLTTHPEYSGRPRGYRIVPASDILRITQAAEMPREGAWATSDFMRLKNTQTGEITIWRKDGAAMVETQTVLVTKDGQKFINGKLLDPTVRPEEQPKLNTVGTIWKLPGDKKDTGPLWPLEYFSTIQNSTLVQWRAQKPIENSDGSVVTIYYPVLAKGSDLLVPGNHDTFKGLQQDKLAGKINFLSLMIALFCGTASLPHILIRYYTVKDQAAVRKSTVVGIASIGFFYVLTFYLGLGAMTSGVLDVTDVSGNMAAPLLAQSFGSVPFAVISAIAFTTVLGTVSGLIMAASGAVAHDLLTNVMKMDLDDHAKVRAGKIAAVIVGVIAMALGIIFEKVNVSFLVGWAFSIAASANLPALVMLLFWKGTTKQGITWAVIVGMLSSLGWILLSKPTFEKVYKIANHPGFTPFDQPAILTVPLGFIVLIIVSLLTQKTGTAQAVAAQNPEMASAK
ncbi:MAG TPA: cation acetate symporter [Planctomycetota bacterium]|nr:cation acetate symporter [Planctomycetota bacterium]